MPSLLGTSTKMPNETLRLCRFPNRKTSPLVRGFLPAFLGLLIVKRVASSLWCLGTWPLLAQKVWEVVVTAVKGLVVASPPPSPHGGPNHRLMFSR